MAHASRVDDVVAADHEMVAYVRDLERRSDQGDAPAEMGDLPSGDALAAEFEQFLRDQDDP
jgi:hypothetical protein